VRGRGYSSHACECVRGRVYGSHVCERVGGGASEEAAALEGVRASCALRAAAPLRGVSVPGAEVVP